VFSHISSLSRLAAEWQKYKFQPRQAGRPVGQRQMPGFRSAQAAREPGDQGMQLK